MKSALFVFLMLFGWALQSAAYTSKYSSREEVMNALAQAGLDQVIEIQGGDFGAPRLAKWPMSTKGISRAVNLNSTEGQIRVPEMDYLWNGDSFLSGLDPIHAQAYRTTDHLLCYYVESSYLSAFQGNRIINCFFFSPSIDQVLLMLKASSK